MLSINAVLAAAPNFYGGKNFPKATKVPSSTGVVTAANEESIDRIPTFPTEERPDMPARAAKSCVK